MKKFFKEFKTFIMRGNVLDMAVGVIIATAFGAITTSLINNILMPVIGYLLGDIDLASWKVVLRQAAVDAVGRIEFACLPDGVAIGLRQAERRILALPSVAVSDRAFRTAQRAFLVLFFHGQCLLFMCI